MQSTSPPVDLPRERHPCLLEPPVRPTLSFVGKSLVPGLSTVNSTICLSSQILKFSVAAGMYVTGAKTFIRMICMSGSHRELCFFGVAEFYHLTYLPKHVRNFKIKVGVWLLVT